MTDIAGERQRLAAQGLRHEFRESWGAVQSYTSDRAVTRPASWLFLHIAVIDAPARTVASERAAMRTIEAIGQQRFGIGCSYNEAAAQSGRLYELQPLTRRGAHTVNDLVNPDFPEGSLNRTARALVLPQDVGDAVTVEQIDAAARWGAACIRAGEVTRGARWYGHRDVTQKACPGPIAYGKLAELNRLTRHYEAQGLGEEDMTPDQARKLDEIHADINSVKFVVDLLWQTQTPSGIRYAVPGTGELVPAGTPGAKPVTDIWRWAREAAIAARGWVGAEPPEAGELEHMLSELRQLHEASEPEPTPGG